MKKIKKILHFIISMPKTIYFNFKYLSVKDAIKLPILVSNRVFLEIVGGKILIDGPVKFRMIKIGFSEPGLFDYKKNRSVWSNKGTIIFKGNASLGSGRKIAIDRESGKIIFGENFTITANTQIWSRNRIEFGKNNLISWDNIIMDTDSHKIYDKVSDNLLNIDKEIKIGDNVWIGCRCTILKGTIIGDDTVIGANSMVNGNYSKYNNVIIGGNPIGIKRECIYWKI